MRIAVAFKAVPDAQDVQVAGDRTLDFSKGPVTFTVTAQDGVHRQSYPVTVTAAASPNRLKSMNRRFFSVLVIAMCPPYLRVFFRRMVCTLPSRESMILVVTGSS